MTPVRLEPAAPRSRVKHSTTALPIFSPVTDNLTSLLESASWKSWVQISASASSLDKQRICVNMQLKSSKKQLKLNACVLKRNSVDLYAITCDVIAYHLVHFVSICVIYKCQSGIDFFLLASAQYNFNL